MKKLLSLITVAALTFSTAQAQIAFRQLGASVEVGTTGIGVNLSYPVVSDHLIVSAGYNFPSFAYTKNIEVGSQYVNKHIEQVKEVAGLYDKGVDIINQFSQKQLPHIGDDVRKIDKITADVKAKVNFGNFKLMLQYYPTTQNSFYLAAGVFIGNGEMATLTGQIDDQVWSIYEKAVEANRELGKIPPAIAEDIKTLLHLDGDLRPVKNLEEAIRFNIGDQTFQIRPEDNGHIEAQLKVNKVKPYLGIGFGNSIPQRHRCGFQMEIGAYYQSKPKLVSTQEVPYDIEAIWQKDLADVKDIIQKFSWYPQLTFRFTGKIF